MSYLKNFAAYVKYNKLDEFVANELKAFCSFNVPLIEHFSDLDKTKLRAIIKDNLCNFLTGIETGTAIQLVKENLMKWENDQLPFPKHVISLSDIALMYTTQKITFLSFLPQFNIELNQAVNIMLELEAYYKEVQELVLNTILKIENKKLQKLKESEEKFRDLFDNTTDLIHMITPEGEIMQVNNAWIKTLGYTARELMGKSVYALIVDKEREKFRKFREAIIAGDSDLKMFETSFMSKQGREVIVEGIITCKYKNGKPLYTRGILRDITRRVENENKLKFYTEQLIEREENIKQLIENAPDSIIVIDEKSKILLWNPKTEEIFGWKAGDVMGTALTETIIPQQYRERHIRGMERLLSTGQANMLNRTIEITAIKKNGDEFYISLTISRSRQINKWIFIAFIRDISTEKENEKELDEKRNQLEKINEELENYARLTSHDLKEPLRKILINSDLLLTNYSATLEPEAINRLEKISNAAKRMNHLIEDVLNYSRVSDKSDFFVPLKLNEVLKDVLSDLENSIEEKRATVIIGDLPEIEGVFLQMRQLFQNLISNAIKYSKPDIPPVIEITCKNSGPGYIELRVKDNGIGIEEKYKDKIFQAYERLHSKDEFEGTGLGLALCKKIAEVHKGSIKIKSEKNIGSTFIIQLPVSKD